MKEKAAGIMLHAAAMMLEDKGLLKRRMSIMCRAKAIITTTIIMAVVHCLRHSQRQRNLRLGTVMTWTKTGYHWSSPPQIWLISKKSRKRRIVIC